MYRCVPVQGMKMPHPKDLTQNKHVAPRKTNEGLTTFVVRQRHANPRILGGDSAILWTDAWIICDESCPQQFARKNSCGVGPAAKVAWLFKNKDNNLCLGQFIVECHMHLSLSRSVFMHNVFASILELIHCFAANSKFRGANCSPQTARRGGWGRKISSGTGVSGVFTKCFTFWLLISI